MLFFKPEDTRFVTDGPNIRRRALDVVVCQIDCSYLHRLSQYRKVLANRDALSAKFRGQVNITLDLVTRQTGLFDEQLAVEGVEVMRKRAA